MSEALAEDGNYSAVGFTYGSDYYDPSEPTEEEEPSKQRGEDEGEAPAPGWHRWPQPCYFWYWKGWLMGGKPVQTLPFPVSCSVQGAVRGPWDSLFLGGDTLGGIL